MSAFLIEVLHQIARAEFDVLPRRARLHLDLQVVGVDADDLVHGGHIQHDAAIAWHGATVPPGGTPSGHHGHALGHGQLDDV